MWRTSLPQPWTPVFKNLSGLVINSSKNKGIWIVSSEGKIQDLFGIKCPNEPIKTLNWVISCTLITSNFCTHKKGIMRLDNHKLTTVKYKSISIKHGLRTADYGLRTGYKIRTRYKTRTGKYGLGIKHGLGIRRGLQAADWV